MAEIINTSYEREYVVVSATRSQVILRPLVKDGEDPIPTYWKEFLGLYDDDPNAPDDHTFTIYLTQLPAEVLSVDAYVDYVVEYPRVEIHYGDNVIDVSDRISCNHPNPETPGLYAIDFMLSIGGDINTPIWRSWVSIEEPPILRHIITPWNRENRTIADFNRLVIEPQFLEALYEAGVPVYNFQQANAIGAVPQSAIMKYRDARLFVQGDNIFVSGPLLPTGTEITVHGQKIILGLRVITAPFAEQDLYDEGDIVRYCGQDFYAIENPVITDEDGTHSAVPNVPTKNSKGEAVTYWLGGILYDTNVELNLPDGEYPIDSLWGVIDVGGYLFKMDLLRAFPVRHYWGIYNSKFFYDYAPGDLVAMITDNVIYLYQRNDTSIAEKGLEETYRPGHYKNPHWIEVYSASNSSLLRDPAIKPYTNAMNAVVCKTYPIREESFRIYAKMVGMPMEIVDGLSPKYSVLLWALLYRTRETFPGFKAAFNAVGLDVSNLYRVHPSVLYNEYDNGGMEVAINSVYTEINKVKQIAKSVQADKVWTNTDANPTTRLDKDDPDNCDENGTYIPWIRYTKTGSIKDTNPDHANWTPHPATTDDTVEIFDNGEWKPFYKFTHVGLDTETRYWDYSVNNRYYRAEVSLLDRLKEDCKIDLNDDKDWIDHNKFNTISYIIGQLLSYEVPIYIYLRMLIHLATVGKVKLRGVDGGVVCHEEWGGFIGLKVFPGNIFDFSSISSKYYYPNVYYSYEDINYDDVGWTLCDDYEAKDGYRYYSFDKAVHLKFAYPEDDNAFKIDAFWISQFTIGCIGYCGSPGTGNYDQPPGDHGFNGFMDATRMSPTSVLYLCKGLVGISACIKMNTLEADAYCLKWQYVFDDPDQWTLDGPETYPEMPFAGWVSTNCKMYGFWSGTVDGFKQSVTKCTAEGYNLTCAWDSTLPMLYIGGGAPRTVYLWDDYGHLRGILMFEFEENMVLEKDMSTYLLKVSFSAE